MAIKIESIGVNLKASRKKLYPKDTIAAFAVRCEIGLSTYKKMEAGDLSVGLGNYYMVAEVLGHTDEFENLFKLPEDWFND